MPRLVDGAYRCGSCQPRWTTTRAQALDHRPNTRRASSSGSSSRLRLTRRTTAASALSRYGRRAISRSASSAGATSRWLRTPPDDVGFCTDPLVLCELDHERIDERLRDAVLVSVGQDVGTRTPLG